jgi:Kdo2-lipid IVA lauroyltransferase/acyltransferase
MYYLLYGFVYLFSLLPLRVLFIISDGIAFLLYRVFGYRKKVVRSNLLIAFPEKSEEERRQIEKKFYRNFVDNFIETLKMISGGPAFANAHFKADRRVMAEEFAKGKRCQFHLGHNFNWELANVAVSAVTDYKMLIAYMPITNKAVDKIFYKIRGASGNGLLPATNMRQAMLPYRNTQYLLALVADQVPGNPEKAYWLNFFGKPTPFVRGPERGAVAGDLSVIFSRIYKVRRGHYVLDYELVTDNPAALAPGELTRRYVKYLEDAIRRDPDMWLWSHRRWKKEWKPEYKKLWIDTAPLPGS